MSSVQKIFVVSVTFLFLTACGLKGDLYLPEAKPQVVDAPVETVQEAVEEVASEAAPETVQESEKQIKQEAPTP